MNNPLALSLPLKGTVSNVVAMQCHASPPFAGISMEKSLYSTKVVSASPVIKPPTFNH